MKIALVLLSYNEVDGLKHYLPQLADICQRHNITEFFGVDGGSTDGSLKLYEDHHVPCYVQDNKGRGEAFKLAFLKTDAEAIIFFSPDGNEDINDLPHFCSALSDGADIVIASRMMKGAKNEEDDSLWRSRKWANQGFTLLANWIWNRNGKFITDTINGYRAFRRDAWDKLCISASDYTIEYQSSIRAFKLNLNIKEFPTHEGQRLGGESYAKSLPTGIRFSKLLLREILIGKNFDSPNKDGQ